MFAALWMVFAEPWANPVLAFAPSFPPCISPSFSTANDSLVIGLLRRKTGSQTCRRRAVETASPPSFVRFHRRDAGYGRQGLPRPVRQGGGAASPLAHGPLR